MTPFNRLLRRALSSWQSWKTKRRLYRAIPKLKEFEAAEKASIKGHGKVEAVRKERVQFMTATLRGNVNG